MDPLSVAASVAGVAAMGMQLSQSIYALITTFYETEREMSDIANDLSLLAMVLSELEGVLRQDSRVYRRRMVKVVNEILENCQGIFHGISEYVPPAPRPMRSSKRFQRRIRFYFQRHRVRPLQARLESLKSTLNVVLNVVHLARVTEGVEYFIPNTGPMFTYADVQKGRNALVGVVLENRRSIQSLKQIEEEGDRGQSLRHTIKDRRDPEVIHEELLREDSASTNGSTTVLTGRRSRLSTSPGTGKKGKGKKEAKYPKESEDMHRRTRETSFSPGMPARSSSDSRYVLVSEHSGRSNWLSTSSETPKKPGPTLEAYELSGPSTSHEGSETPSTASEDYEMPPEFPVTGDSESSHSEDEITARSSRPQITATTQRPAINGKERSISPPSTGIVTPTAQWFLSVVPHESSVTTLIVRPRSGQEDHLRARAEETSKTLLLNWTNVDPDSISGDNVGGWSQADSFDNYESRPGRDGQITTQQYRTPYAPQAYPTYAPQPWYQPPVYALPPSTATVTNPPAPIDENEKDKEALARLKKLILEEKAEQDMRAAAAAAAASPPPSVPSPPPPPADTSTSIATEELQEDEMEREDTKSQKVGSLQTPQDSSTLWRAGHPTQQPVTMTDWLGRSFIFPIKMCQTWEGLHNLIQGAFEHDLEYRPMVDKGKYHVSNEAGEIILPFTWEHFVQPGMEIRIEIFSYEADRDLSGGKMTVSETGEQSSPNSLIQPSAPEVPSIKSPKTLRSRSDSERSLDGITDDGTETSNSDVISYVERSDPRYLSIERALLEQKQAQVQAEMKLERNRRFFQLKQQLVEQGAAIQAREDAADHVEQDSKLAWLEKRVRDQKEELDRLSPLLMTAPSSSAGLSSDKSTSSLPRKTSLGARLLGRLPSRSNRSRDSVQSQKLITEG